LSGSDYDSETAPFSGPESISTDYVFHSTAVREAVGALETVTRKWILCDDARRAKNPSGSGVLANSSAEGKTGVVFDPDAAEKALKLLIENAQSVIGIFSLFRELETNVCSHIVYAKEEMRKISEQQTHEEDFRKLEQKQKQTHELLKKTERPAEGISAERNEDPLMSGSQTLEAAEALIFGTPQIHDDLSEAEEESGGQHDDDGGSHPAEYLIAEAEEESGGQHDDDGVTDPAAYLIAEEIERQLNIIIDKVVKISEEKGSSGKTGTNSNNDANGEQQQNHFDKGDFGPRCTSSSEASLTAEMIRGSAVYKQESPGPTDLDSSGPIASSTAASSISETDATADYMSEFQRPAAHSDAAPVAHASNGADGNAAFMEQFGGGIGTSSGAASDGSTEDVVSRSASESGPDSGFAPAAHGTTEADAGASGSAEAVDSADVTPRDTIGEVDEGGIGSADSTIATAGGAAEEVEGAAEVDSTDVVTPGGAADEVEGAADNDSTDVVTPVRAARDEEGAADVESADIATSGSAADDEEGAAADDSAADVTSGGEAGEGAADDSAADVVTSGGAADEQEEEGDEERGTTAAGATSSASSTTSEDEDDRSVDEEVFHSAGGGGADGRPARLASKVGKNDKQKTTSTKKKIGVRHRVRAFFRKKPKKTSEIPISRQDLEDTTQELSGLIRRDDTTKGSQGFLIK